MDFRFSDEQNALRESVRSFLEARAPSAYVRSMLEDDRGFTDDVWSGLVDLGVVARADDGIATFLVDGPMGEPVPTLDPSRKAARAELSATRAERVGPTGDQTELWQRIIDDASVMLCAELVGSSEQALHLAAEY